MIVKKYFFLLCTLFLFRCYAKDQKLAIIFVIDQLSYDAFQKQVPYFNHGFKKLLHNGTFYHQAYYPHARPSTAPGHTALSTGTVAKYHGIIANKWKDTSGNIVYCNQDDPQNAAVFSPAGLYSYGISSRLTMADTICDQLILAGSASSASFSHKTRSATATAGKLGKPFWFDKESGQMTSSKAYFETLPAWIKLFNKEHPLHTAYEWQLAYPRSSNYYAMVDTNSYQYAKKTALAGKKIVKKHDTYGFYKQLPESNKLILDCALTWLSMQIDKKIEKILLWISLSSLDSVGHEFGQNSYEYVDTLYHLDQYIDSFMHHVEQKTATYEKMIIVTADHGALPTVELLQEKKFSLAQRVSLNEFIQDLNLDIEQDYGIKDIVENVIIPNIYLNKAFFALQKDKQKLILDQLKKNLLSKSFIQHVWTSQELMKSAYQLPQLECYFQNQWYPGRSGSLIFQIKPYTYLSNNLGATGHISPYNYDTHVPLIIIQQDSSAKPTNTEKNATYHSAHKIINQKVWIPQVAITLSNFFNCGTPSCALFDALPS